MPLDIIDTYNPITKSYKTISIILDKGTDKLINSLKNKCTNTRTVLMNTMTTYEFHQAGHLEVRLIFKENIIDILISGKYDILEYAYLKQTLNNIASIVPFNKHMTIVKLAGPMKIRHEDKQYILGNYDNISDFEIITDLYRYFNISFKIKNTIPEYI